MCSRRNGLWSRGWGLLAGLLSLGLVMANGAAGEDAAEGEMMRRIAVGRQEPVPLPAPTPFDSDPKARAVYLQEYAAAYRLVLAAVEVGCHMAVKGYYEEAFHAGWRDGREAGRKNHPEKVAETLGISLEDYLRHLKETGSKQ